MVKLKAGVSNIQAVVLLYPAHRARVFRGRACYKPGALLDMGSGRRASQGCIVHPTATWQAATAVYVTSQPKSQGESDTPLSRSLT